MADSPPWNLMLLSFRISWSALTVSREYTSCARGFCGAAVLSPEVHDVGERQRRDIEGGGFFSVKLGVELVGDPKAAVHLGKLIGAGDAQISAGLEDAGGRNLHIVVVGQ